MRRPTPHDRWARREAALLRELEDAREMVDRLTAVGELIDAHAEQVILLAARCAEACPDEVLRRDLRRALETMAGRGDPH